MALTVKVRGVPMVSERKKIRRTADAPAQVSVPLIVWLALKITVTKPAPAGAVIDRLLYVAALKKFLLVLVFAAVQETL
jgi:hypothetical protein